MMRLLRNRNICVKRVTILQPMLQFIELIAVLVIAIASAIEARRRNMDLIGAYVIAFIVALGGGTLRDILLNRHPLYWIENPSFASLIFVVALISSIMMRISPHLPQERFVIVMDAIALGLFSASGTEHALALQIAPFIAVLMGVITATFGGVLRDILFNQVPTIFMQHTQLYATCAFMGGLTYWWLRFDGADVSLATLASIMVAAGLRLLAMRFDWRLPL